MANEIRIGYGVDEDRPARFGVSGWNQLLNIAAKTATKVVKAQTGGFALDGKKFFEHGATTEGITAWLLKDKALGRVTHERSREAAFSQVEQTLMALVQGVSNGTAEMGQEVDIKTFQRLGTRALIEMEIDVPEGDMSQMRKTSLLTAAKLAWVLTHPDRRKGDTRQMLERMRDSLEFEEGAIAVSFDSDSSLSATGFNQEGSRALVVAKGIMTPETSLRYMAFGSSIPHLDAIAAAHTETKVA